MDTDGETNDIEDIISVDSEEDSQVIHIDEKEDGEASEDERQVHQETQQEIRETSVSDALIINIQKIIENSFVSPQASTLELLEKSLNELDSLEYQQ